MMWNEILNIDNLFIYSICLVFSIGLMIEIKLTLNYYRETAKRAKQTSETRDLSIFNKGNIRSPLHFIPTLLTALGILGTFWGIFRGLEGIDLDSINNTDILLANSADLLVGMKTAFQSSLWGLGGASLFILFLAITEGLKRDRRNHFLKKLRQIGNDQNNSDFLNQLRKIANKMEGLGTLNAQDIGQEVATAFKPTFQEMSNYLNTQNQTLQSIAIFQPKTIAEEIAIALKPTFLDIKTDLNLQGQALRKEVIEPVGSCLDNTAKITKEAAIAVQDLKKELGSFSESLANSIQTIQQFQKHTLGQLETFAQNLQQILNQFQTDTQGVMEQMTTDIHHVVHESILGMESQRTAFAESAQQASITFQSIREDLQAALNTQAQQQKMMLETVQTSTENILKEANNAFLEQSNTLTRIGNEASAMITNANENLRSSITETLNESISGLEAQRNAFTESTEETAQTFQHIREDLQAALNTQARQQQVILEDVQTSTEMILQEANNAFLEQSNTLTRVGNEASTIMSQASNHLSQTLTNVDTMLQNTRQTVQEELETFRINYQDSLHQFFEQQDTLLGETLGKQREGLAVVVKDFQKVFQEDAIKMGEQVISSMDKIENTAKNVSDLANTMGLNSAERLAQLQKIAQTLSRESEIINHAYETLIERFNQGLESWNQSLTQYFEQANETYQQGRQESEQAAVEVCYQLHETSQGLMSVAHYLVAAANDLNNTTSYHG